MHVTQPSQLKLGETMKPGLLYYCVVQYSTVQYSTVQYSTVQCSTSIIASHVVMRQMRIQHIQRQATHPSQHSTHATYRTYTNQPKTTTQESWAREQRHGRSWQLSWHCCCCAQPPAQRNTYKHTVQYHATQHNTTQQHNAPPSWRLSTIMPNDESRSQFRCL